MNIQVEVTKTICHLQLMKRIQYKKGISSILFQGQKLITAFINLRVWNFIGQFKLLRKQETNKNCYIQNFVFNQNGDWLALGYNEGSIQTWKQQPNGHWIGAQPVRKHYFVVKFLIFSKNENELLTCSFDRLIQVWKVNCQNNGLEYYYTLKDKSSHPFISISLNELETVLLTCDSNQRYILWTKNGQNKWQLQREISNDFQIREIYFVGDYHFILEEQKKSKFHSIEINNNQLIKISELSLPQFKRTHDSFNVFPNRYNRKNQIIVQNSEKYIYILKIQNSGKLELIYSILKKEIDQIGCATMMSNGQYLAITTIGGIELYRILYK